MRLGRLVILLVGLLAVACQSAIDSTNSVPSSSTPTSNSVTETTNTSVVEVDPHIVFEAIDTGVASTIKFLDPELLLSMQQAEFDPAGDQFDLIGCRTTWFGNYEFEFEWAPGLTADSNSVRQIVVSLAVGDTGVLGGFFEVELSKPGRFVVPVVAFDPVGSPVNTTGRREISGQTGFLDGSTNCMPMYFGMPVVEPSNPWTPMTAEITAPLPLHPTDSLQGVIEGMDPIDQDTPLRPLGALAGVMPEFPIDVVYVISGGRMTTASFETDGACQSLTSIYGEAAVVVQHAGCFNGRFGGVSVDDDWTIEMTGDFALKDLEPLLWIGHPGVEIPRTAEEYLDQRNLPENSTEVFRTEVNGTLVTVIRYEADDGTVSYSMDGLGENSGGGGFPGEVWAGCYQVEWKDTGYSMVIVGDPDWTVRVQNEPIELTDTGGVGIAVVPEPIRNREQLTIETETGQRPACVDY